MVYYLELVNFTWSSDPNDEHVAFWLLQDPRDPTEVLQRKVEQDQVHRLPAHWVVLHQKFFRHLSELLEEK